jgi:UDP-N-acetyl-alpha-D-muramoyl-L-alanyl-L-glutamate epimerase
MKQYQTFIFESIDFDEQARSIELNYSLDGEIQFTEKLILPKNVPLRNLREPHVQRALSALHIIGGISYYKTCLPKKIEIPYRTLGKDEAAFWNTVYEKGLGEFFYKNKIESKGVVNFVGTDKSPQPAVSSSKADNKKPKVLVPIGGGKDSLVTVELLKKAGCDITLFRMGHHPFITNMAQVAGLHLVNIERHLSKELFELNEQGALNGHIPITAYLHCVSTVIALLMDQDYIALSNERSADEGNMIEGLDVNHQWSKSLVFENMFSEYLRTYITSDLTVFSLLRPLSELQIARELSKHDQYLDHFTSCNKNWKIIKGTPMENRWCCMCPKCAFAFVLFAGFLPKKKMIEIFGKDLFDDAALLPMFKELLGIEGHKPFECVGTAKEVAAAFFLALKTGEWDDTWAMKMFVSDAQPKIKDRVAVIKEALTTGSTKNIPDVFRTVLKDLS